LFAAVIPVSVHCILGRLCQGFIEPIIIASVVVDASGILLLYYSPDATVHMPQASYTTSTSSATSASAFERLLHATIFSFPSRGSGARRGGQHGFITEAKQVCGSPKFQGTRREMEQ
jgi:hypothetical protein